MSSNFIQNPVEKNDLVIFIDQVATQVTQVATVPTNWRRLLIDDRIVYVTPSQKFLHSMDEVSNYLLSDGTCKCGLSCPFSLEFFNFDPQVESVENAVDETKLNCKHRPNIANRYQSNQTSSTSTNSNMIYQSKVIYTPTIQHTSNGVQTTPNKLIVQSTVANDSNRTTNYPVTIQSILKPVEQSSQMNTSKQIFIPIRKDQLNNLSNIGQPIILQASQIKAQTTNSSPQILQFLNTSQFIQPMVIQQSQSTKNST